MLRSLLPLLTLALTAACNPTQAVPTNGVSADEGSAAEVESPDPDESPTEEGLAQADEPEAADEPAEAPDAAAETPASLWAPIVETYATDDGGFQYAALMANEDHMARLQAAVEATATYNPSELERDAQLAFYINAYNLLTVASVIELWPVESVLSEDGFFDGREHTVAGASMTLNGLENDIIRANYGEPRIHFAVNCASTGCPPLMNRVWTAETLEADLDRQTRAYVNGTTLLDTEANSVQVSQIFEWFAGDFEASGGVRAFVADHIDPAHADFVRADSTTIGFFEYDWTLNGRP